MKNLLEVELTRPTPHYFFAPTPSGESKHSLVIGRVNGAALSGVVDILNNDTCRTVVGASG